MTVVTIRQPGYLPYIGFFKKIQTSDIFVCYDDAQYTVKAWDNRNKIRTHNGSMWLTVPVHKPFKKKLNEVEIVNTASWNKQHQLAIKSNYGKAPYFDHYWNEIEEILNRKWQKLMDLNLEFIQYFNKVLGIQTKFMKSTELGITQYASSEKLLEICKKLNATIYMSGAMGKEYLDEKIFHDAGINVVYENFQHPVYKQLHGDFIPNMSIIDLLFNEGDNSQEILLNSSNM